MHIGKCMRCTAYCTAKFYNFPALIEILKQHYVITVYRDAIHVSYDPERADVCFFSYGVFVAFGLSEEEELEITRFVKEVEIEPLTRFESDSYDFSYGETRKIGRDEIILPNKEELVKLAVAYGLAQSVKLVVFEATIDKTIKKTKHLPEDLARKGKIFLKRKEISKKIGELFIDRSSVNLHSDILDEPEFFWEYPEHHPVYRDVTKSLDITTRIDVLNSRLAIVSELLQMLSDQLNHQHSSTLEWTIIWLIVIEVVLAASRDLFHLI